MFFKETEPFSAETNPAWPPGMNNVICAARRATGSPPVWQPVRAAFVMVCGEHDGIGGMVVEVAQHSLHRIVLLGDNFADIDAKLRHGGTRTVLGQQPPAFEGFAHAGEVRPFRRPSRARRAGA